MSDPLSDALDAGIRAASKEDAALVLARFVLGQTVLSDRDARRVAYALIREVRRDERESDARLVRDFAASLALVKARVLARQVAAERTVPVRDGYELIGLIDQAEGRA